MNLKQQIDAELSRLATDQDAAPKQLTVETPDGLVQCDLEQVDRLACSFERLVYRTDLLADATPDRLRDISEQLAAKLTYLLEPIVPLEVDAEGRTVQMRSSPPEKEEERIGYYELLVQRGGQLSLSRYCQPRRQPRRQVPANITWEVFQRLVADLVEAARVNCVA